MAYRARNDGGHHEYECDAEADLATIVNPKQGESALALSEGTTWYHTGSAWAQTVGSPGSGAPADATYLTATANGTLSNEVVVGATPGGELGGTWATPTVDASHSGSTHAAVQAAAEATAAADVATHEADTTSVHGITDTSAVSLNTHTHTHAATTGQTANQHHNQAHDNGDHTTTGTPGNSAVGDAAAQGSSASVARLDHAHGREAFATPAVVLGTAAAAGVATTPIRSDSTILAFDVTAPTTSALADAAAVGTATTAARRDHKHGRESFATPAIVLGSAAAAGSATTPIRSDGTIAAFDATAPTTQAFSDAAAVGTAAFAARRDHKHAMMATPWGGTYFTPQTADVTTSETTASASFTDLTTPGPAITATTGTSVFVTVSADISNGVGSNKGFMGFAVSSASTVAAAAVDSAATAGTVPIRVTRRILVTGLTAGSNVFTAKYATSSGTGTFLNRRIIVEAA